MAFQFGAERMRVAEEREDVGAGEQAAQAVEHLFASPSIEQPVVDNRCPHDLQHTAEARDRADLAE